MHRHRPFSHVNFISHGLSYIDMSLGRIQGSYMKLLWVRVWWVAEVGEFPSKNISLTFWISSWNSDEEEALGQTKETYWRIQMTQRGFYIVLWYDSIEPNSFLPYSVRTYSKILNEMLFFPLWLCQVFIGACGILLLWYVSSMWDLVLWLGIEPSPLKWEHKVLVSGPPGKSRNTDFYQLPDPQTWRF